MNQQKELQPKQRSWFRRNWWLILCLVVPFVIGGSVGWLLVIAQDDHPGQGLNEQQYKEHERAVDLAAASQFLQFGLISGITGLGIGFAFVLKTRRKAHQR